MKGRIFQFSLLVVMLTTVFGCSRKEPEVNSNVNTNVGVATSSTATTTPIIDPKTGWNVYRNDKYNFSLEYPINWRIEERVNFKKGFFVTNGISYVAILPDGEFDYGTPVSYTSSRSHLSNLDVQVQRYLDKEKIVETYYFIKSPISWIQCKMDKKSCGRIEVHSISSDYGVIERILGTLQII